MAFCGAASHPVDMRIMLCCLLVVACGGAGPEKAPAPPASPPMRVFDRTLHATTFNGTRLTYRVTGDSGAPPVVFVHGTLADLNSWGGQENLFAQRYRVFVYGRRYHRPNPQVEVIQTYSPMRSSCTAKCSRSAVTTCRQSRARSSAASRRRCCSFGANGVRAYFS